MFFFTQCHFNSLYVVTLLLSTDGRSNNKRLLIALVFHQIVWVYVFVHEVGDGYGYFVTLL